MRADDAHRDVAARVPRLAAGADPTRLKLSPEEGYLLSRIDGRTPWDLLRKIGGLPPGRVDRCLERWLAEGLLTLDGPDSASSSSESPPETRPAAPAAAAPPAAEVDPSLEIPVETQRRVLDLLGRLDRPYHEILGVALDADPKKLKRAYFRLSREFHPDRYFRRKLGPFEALVERVFKKIVEAYELLSDPTARVEIERSLKEKRSEAGAPDSPAARFRPGRHVFDLHARALRERKRKAKALFESGMAAFATSRWLEAAAGVRLAIAFDPWNEVYREEFGPVQRKAHEERAKQLIREAESALDLRDHKAAFRLFEDALHYRPHDASLNHRAAKLAWLAESDLHRAKEYAMHACELEPENAEYHRTLGQIYKAAGLEANARRELELALRHDPNDAEAKAELRSLGRRLKFPLSLGGRR